MTVTSLFLVIFIVSILIIGCTEFIVYTATLRIKNNTTSDYTDDTTVFNDSTLKALDITVEKNKKQIQVNSAIKTQDDIEQVIEPVCNIRHVNDVPSASTILGTN